MDDLVARAKRGDRAALESLVEAHLDSVYRLVALRLGSTSPAVDDVVQETLIGAMKTVGRLRGDDEPAFVRWLFSIARFKVADHYRSAYKRPVEALPTQRRTGEATEAGPEDIAERRAQAEELRVALAELTPEQEEVLTLKFVLGYENEEIAVISGRTVGAVKSMQHRGLATLARRLGAEAATWN